MMRSPSARFDAQITRCSSRKGPDISQDLSPMLPGRQHHMLRQPPGVVSRSPGTTMRGFMARPRAGAERARARRSRRTVARAPPGLAGVPTTYDRMRMQNHISYGAATAMAARRGRAPRSARAQAKASMNSAPTRWAQRARLATPRPAPQPPRRRSRVRLNPAPRRLSKMRSRATRRRSCSGRCQGGMGSPQSMNISPMMQFRPPDRMMDPSWQPGMEPVVASHSGVPMLLKVRFTAPPPSP